MTDKDQEVRQVATNVVESLSAIEESFRRAKLELLRKESELFKPLYAKREKLTSAIPHFWSTVLSIEDELAPVIGEGEADLLKSCTSFRVERLDSDPRDFSLTMTFSRNGYLENASCDIAKDFKFDGGRLTSNVVKLDWQKGRDLPALAATQDRLSFFSLFSFVGTADDTDRETTAENEDEEGGEDEDDPQLVLEDMAMLLADEVYPHALSYFTDALLPPETPAESPMVKAVGGGVSRRTVVGETTSGSETPFMALESMTTSFLDQQERVNASRQTNGQDPLPSGSNKNVVIDASIGAGKSHQLSEVKGDVERYAGTVSTDLPDFILRHRTESIAAFNELKMITLNEAQFLHFLTSQGRCKRVLEIGCFTGFSAMVLADAGAEEVLTCELDPELASFAKLALFSAGLGDRVTVLVGDAHVTVADSALVRGKFDLVFIDAEKEGYASYLATVLRRGLLAPGGVVVADNTLRRGCVATEKLPERQHTAETREERTRNDAFESGVRAMREFNAFVKSRDELESVLLPAWDGCTLIRYKR